MLIEIIDRFLFFFKDINCDIEKRSDNQRVKFPKVGIIVIDLYLDLWNAI